MFWFFKKTITKKGRKLYWLLRQRRKDCANIDHNNIVTVSKNDNNSNNNNSIVSNSNDRYVDGRQILNGLTMTVKQGEKVIEIIII